MGTHKLARLADQARDRRLVLAQRGQRKVLVVALDARRQRTQRRGRPAARPCVRRRLLNGRRLAPDRRLDLGKRLRAHPVKRADVQPPADVRDGPVSNLERERDAEGGLALRIDQGDGRSRGHHDLVVELPPPHDLLPQNFRDWTRRRGGGADERPQRVGQERLRRERDGRTHEVLKGHPDLRLRGQREGRLAGRGDADARAPGLAKLPEGDGGTQALPLLRREGTEKVGVARERLADPDRHVVQPLPEELAGCRRQPDGRPPTPRQEPGAPLRLGLQRGLGSPGLPRAASRGLLDVDQLVIEGPQGPPMRRRRG